MIERKWTPGPWRVRDAFGEPVVCEDDAHGTFIALVHEVQGRERRSANAHLIAAAPELYEACEYALAGAIFEDADPITQMLRAALAKARGEQP